nr:IL-18 binding protein [Oriental turtle dovepox virus]
MPEDENTTSLICVGCGRKGSSARIFWVARG